ncbi:hypothetical protein [Mycolicibacterium lacusdiani]|uniref:hypothetical protein n=1 Tax=Mycolicibacterium lacusdiani TaxID=2895283 RepID=UPI001F395D4C|nr:hypothetical protein [Mycolicibacterium lacusdiani]
MPHADGAVISGHAPASTVPTVETPAATVATHVALHGWQRVVAVVALSAVAYSASYQHVLADAIAGSRATHLVVVPLLLAMIATGYREAPRGVSDSESDWIIATLLGVTGMTVIHLLSGRAESLAGLWRLHLLAIVVWLACAVAVMFGVRHTVRMWALWVFAICFATPLPFMLATAGLGGSDIAYGVVTAAMGALAVFLAGRSAPAGIRSCVALGSLAVAGGIVVAVGDRLGLLPTVLVTGGLVPVAATVLLARVVGAPTDDAPLARRSLPHRSLTSLAILGATAVALLATTPVAVRPAVMPTVDANWADRADLTTPTSFPFITDFLGPQSTLVRYDLPGSAVAPAAAVDVMTTSDPAALDDFADAVWYPTSRPLDYRPITGPSVPLGARVIKTNADAATDGAGHDWYAVTWTWHAGALSQRVTVVVSQTIGGDRTPPAPQPLSLLDTAVRPALWVARQQPNAAGTVDPRVSQRATQVMSLLAPPADVAAEAPAGD